MARFGRKGVIRRFKIRTQVIYGKRGSRIAVIAPGIRRARAKRTISRPVIPQDGKISG